jgi:hypothetical protein
MARVDDLLAEALSTLEAKPPDTSSRSQKKRYSELVSAKLAQALGEELRRRGLQRARPAPPSVRDPSGAERRMAGGIGAKKVDVTWATEESGLLLGISIKSINFKDMRTGNYQKNLTNRRGDMLMEAVTLHRRFPYAVLGGLFFLDKEAANDDTARRRSTLQNAHRRMQLFTGRADPAGRDEQYEKLYLLLLDASPANVKVTAYEVGHSNAEISLEHILDELLNLIAERNPDFYEFVDGNIVAVNS